jgi:hypothetical protein
MQYQKELIFILYCPVELVNADFSAGLRACAGYARCRALMLYKIFESA